MTCSHSLSLALSHVLAPALLARLELGGVGIERSVIDVEHEGVGSQVHTVLGLRDLREGRKGWS